MEGKIRVIDKKGNARWVIPVIANNDKLMKSYGFKIQDLNVKEEEKPVEVDPLVFDGMGKEIPNETLIGEDGIGEIPEEKPKVKTGRKSK
jgi:hypothetical protein